MSDMLNNTNMCNHIKTLNTAKRGFFLFPLFYLFKAVVMSVKNKQGMAM